MHEWQDGKHAEGRKEKSRPDIHTHFNHAVTFWGSSKTPAIQGAVGSAQQLETDNICK